MSAGATSARPRLGVRALLTESLAGVMARPGRTALTVLGTVLGITALVATLGISKTAGNQIVGRFDELAATEVRVEPSTVTIGTQTRATVALPWDVEQRLLPLNGVRAAGAYIDVNVANGAAVRTTPRRDRSGNGERQLRTVAVSPGLLDALHGRVVEGRWFDVGHATRADRVVVLGAEAAVLLGIGPLERQPAIFIGEQAYTVIGVIDGLRRDADLTSAVLFPSGLAKAQFATSAPKTVVIDTQIGAAALIAGQAPIALAPNNPAGLAVNAPPNTTRTTKHVEGDVNALFLMLGVVALVVGAIGIANVTLVTVLERVGEIGLRRAMGAARRHIAYQFLVESAMTGLLGGMLGASLGVVLTVSVSAARKWTPVLDASMPLAAPLLGGAIGLVAGLYPSMRAARLEPVDALRAGL